jgi:hypothetical protein
MGTKVAPTYAILTLGYLETTLYNTIQLKYPENVYTHFINNYFRFIDDIFIIYNHNYITIDEIYILLNSLDCALNFKCETHGNKVNFLDIKIYKVDNRIDTDIFYKATDTRQYLDFHSNHSRHTKRAIPYNLSRRICTIVSDLKIRDIRLEELREYLKRCNYPMQLIQDGIKKVTSYDRNQ